MEKEFGRPLMTAAEVMALDPELSLVFTPSTDPLKISRYSWKDYLEQTNYAPPMQQEVKVDPNLVLLLEDQERPPKWEEELKDPPETPAATVKKPAPKAKSKAAPQLTDSKRVAKPKAAEDNERPKKVKPKPKPAAEDDDEDECLPI
jgi:type IV secretory pathway TraG/TraD family ATPase VirD4